MKPLLAAIWRYRHFIASSVRNDFRLRFARSRLGAAWMILQPLAQVAIFTLVLSEVLAARLPQIESKNAYAIYLMAGMLGWSLFSEILLRSVSVFIDNGTLLKKIAFPRICLPLIVIGSSLLNNVLLFLAMVAIFALIGHAPTAAMLWLPVLTALTLALGLGSGLLLGVLNVFVRDIGAALGVVLQLLFWMTPVVYMPSVVPGTFQRLLAFNPLYGIVKGYQDVILFGKAPDVALLAMPALLALALLVASLLLFRRAAPDLVDEL